MQNTKQVLNKKKYKYIFLFTIIILGIISGIILANILSYNDKKIVSNTIQDYLLNLKEGKNLNYIANLFDVIKVNYIYFILLIVLSLSIIGIIFNPFILYIKCVIVGFTIGIMINIYGYLGIIFGLLFVFPHQIINIIIYMVITYYGMILSIKLFKLIFYKEQFNIITFRKKFLKVISFGSVFLLISSLYETFLEDYILKLFTFMIK